MTATTGGVADVPLRDAPWPRLARCERCGAEVLRARRARGGRPLTLEPMPILVGERRCATCRGRGLHGALTPARFGALRGVEPGDLAGKMVRGEMTGCLSCEGKGVRGEELSAEHVVMTIDGIVRDEPVIVTAWDSAYRRHRCVDRERAA